MDSTYSDFIFKQIVRAIKIDCIRSLNFWCCPSVGPPKKNVFNILDKYGNSPLMLAARLGSVHCVKFLIDHGASCKIINVYGQNALSLAAYSGNIKIVKLLLKEVSYYDYTITSTVPPLCVAAMQGNLSMVKYFTRFSPDISTVKTAQGVNAYQMAIVFNQEHVMAYLSKLGNTRLKTDKNAYGHNSQALKHYYEIGSRRV